MWSSQTIQDIREEAEQEARTIILETIIEADTEEKAFDIAFELEENGRLGLEEWTAKEGSEVSDITDEENIWEVEEV